MTTLFNSVSQTKLLIVLLLVAATLVAYEPVRKYEFSDYDDDRYITNNPRIQQGLSRDNIVWALTATEVANWHPLTWLSHMTDCQLYGLNAPGHHLTSLIFHLINVILLFFVLHEMTGAVWRSALCAALFALHPLNVESVAWIAERKNVLSTMFWLLVMWAYVSYAREPGWKRYLLVILLFIMGLMSKPMLVTLPCVLLLLDYWPLGRLERWRNGSQLNDQSCSTEQDFDQGELRSRTSKSNSLIPGQTLFHLMLEKVPLFLLAAASSAITIKAQRLDGALNPVVLSFSTRAANALVAYASYIYKMIWPTRLAVFYPHPGASLPRWQVILSALALASISALVWRGRERFRYLPVGWLWYLGTLVPVIGLVQVGNQAMADRYAYVPLIGLFIIIAWGLADLTRHLSFRKQLLVGVAASVMLIALLIATRRQVSYWQNGITLFARALAVTDNNAIAHNNLGAVLVREGRLAEGLEHLYAAVTINPQYDTAYTNIAVTLYRQGAIMQEQNRRQEAINLYRQALELKPDFAEAREKLDLLAEQEEQIETSRQ